MIWPWKKKEKEKPPFEDAFEAIRELCKTMRELNGEINGMIAANQEVRKCHREIAEILKK
jgi:hypothetical protein